MATSGIMSMFNNLMGGGAPAPNTPAPGGQPGTPGNIPQGTPVSGAASAGAAPNGMLPSAGGPGGEPSAPTEATPFEPFQELWSNEPADPNAPPAGSGVFGNVDPKKFMEAAGKIDFSKAVTPEQLTAISGGGDAAVQAFAAAMNKVAQGVYAQSAFATTKIVEQALAKTKDQYLAELPTHIKKQTVTDSLRAENPIFSNPAVSPIISALESQLTVKFPNASAPEITALARQYVEALGTSFAKKPEPAAPVKGAKAEVDWEKFLSE
jgi:hypothetical protein